MKEAANNCRNNSKGYVLATAAYNEEKYIEKTLRSVVAQTVLPRKWVIVNDGSTDRTEEIILDYAAQHRFIELHRITEDHPRNLTAQVHAINAGFVRLKGVDYDFIGNLDSDISLTSTYFEYLLHKFQQDPQLGLAGGFICEEQDGEFQNRPSNTVTSVAHAVQLFRRECLEALGGYKPFSWAGADWYAEVSLRMMGWHVRSVPELQAFHHRKTGEGFGRLRYCYRHGIMDFYMGTHPLFEIIKIARRLPQRPYLLGALLRLSAFTWSHCSGRRRQVSDEFMRFLREEQMARLRLRSLKGPKGLSEYSH
jgi:poly-beta-1,6-N-acetyl-D-glucosamine synthase